MDAIVEKAHAYLRIVMNRGTATYKNGILDFTHGEGGNNHIHLLNANRKEIGYIWFDTHCQCFGFCGKGEACVNGVFRKIVMEEFGDRWSATNRYLFRFTPEMFVKMMDRVIETIR